MKILGALLGTSLFESLSAVEWTYLGVGIATVIALIVTIIVALLRDQSAETVKDAPAEKKSEPAPAKTAVVATTATAPASVETPVSRPVVAPVVAKPSDKSEQEHHHNPDEHHHHHHKHHEEVTRGKVLIRYDKSQTAKMMQAEKEVKDYYDIIKNELLSYKGVRCRLSWKHEAFYKGRVLVAKLKVRGKHLRLLLPLDPKDYIDTKYKVKDLSDKKNHADTPLGYSIKNDRRSVYAKDLIATVMLMNGVEKAEETEFVKYSLDFPYDTTPSLIRRKLIKLLYSKVEGEADADGEYEYYEPVEAISVDDVSRLMTDEEAEQNVEVCNRIADKTKTGIVNVDVLSKVFSAGEKVTLDEIKKRVVGFNKKITYVKVLARGFIDKPLIVEADDYSLDAVKMILLTGGTVIRTRKK